MKNWLFVTYPHHLARFQSYLQHTGSFLDKFIKKNGDFHKNFKSLFIDPFLSLWWPLLRGKLRGYSTDFLYVSLQNMKKKPFPPQECVELHIVSNKSNPLKRSANVRGVVKTQILTKSCCHILHLCISYSNNSEVDHTIVENCWHFNFTILRGFDLYSRHGVPCIPGEEMLFFFHEMTKGSKKSPKGFKNWHLLAFWGVFLAKGTWASIFFFGIMTWQKHWNNYWNEKKIENFVKIVFFLINLSKQLTLCCKWLWNFAKWCR